MENTDSSSTHAKEISDMQNDIKYLRDMIVPYVQRPIVEPSDTAPATVTPSVALSTNVTPSVTNNNELGMLNEQIEQLKNSLKQLTAPSVEIQSVQNNDELSKLKEEFELLKNSIQVVKPQQAIQEQRDERTLAIQQTEIRYTVFYLGSALFALAALRIIVAK